MSCLILTAQEVHRLLPMNACIDLMAEALGALARGAGQQPLRHGLRLRHGRGILGLMPGALDAPDTFGLKVIAVFPANHGTVYDSHQGAVMLFEPEHGTPVTIQSASAITAIRTAAASGLATRLLAREDAGVLGMLGSGVQAHTHLDAMAAVRPLREARVYSRDAARREACARAAAERLGIPVRAVGSAREAVAGADLVCTTTSATEPVLLGEWLAPGCHINAVGSSVKQTRELDTAAVRQSRLYVDRRESALNEAGDLLIPMQEGALDERHIVGELGDVVIGKLAGRGGPREITLFKSLGLAVEDLVAAHYVYHRAREAGVGVEVSLEGRTDATH